MPAILREVRDWSRVNYSELYEVCVDRWYRPPLFIVGDAAHAMTPNLGQGANSAMVDSLVLMRLLADGLRRGDPLERVGEAYDGLRRPFVTRIQKMARQIGRLAALRSAPARFLRRGVFFVMGLRFMQKRGQLVAAGYHPAEESYLRPL